MQIFTVTSTQLYGNYWCTDHYSEFRLSSGEELHLKKIIENVRNPSTQKIEGISTSKSIRRGREGEALSSQNSISDRVCRILGLCTLGS